MFTSGNVPSSWQRALFKLLPKIKVPKSVSDFRPIANVRLLYTVFAYLVLGRMEPAPETNQPEEPHGFQGRRIEEHFLAANVCLQKTLAAKTPCWIISLDRSKAFDKVDWNILECMIDHVTTTWDLGAFDLDTAMRIFGQTDVVKGYDTDSCGFNIRGVVFMVCENGS